MTRATSLQTPDPLLENAMSKLIWSFAQRSVFQAADEVLAHIDHRVFGGRCLGVAAIKVKCKD